MWNFIIPLLLDLAAAVKYDCFKPIFPYVYGSANANAEITAAHLVDGTNYVRIYVGGLSYDPDLFGSADPAPFTNPRAFISRLTNHYDVSLTSDFEYNSGFEFFRAFTANTAIAKVLAIAEYTDGAGAETVYALVDTHDSSEQYLSIMDSELKHKKQFALREPSSCSAAKKIRAPNGSIGVDGSGKLHIVVGYEDTREYAVVQFDYNFYDSTSEIKTEDAGVIIKRFECSTASDAAYCRPTAFFQQTSAFFIAAVSVDTSASEFVHVVIHKFTSATMNLDWTVNFRETTSQQASVGTIYLKINDFDYCSNTLFYMVNKGSSDYYWGRIINPDATPSSASLYYPNNSPETARYGLGVACTDASNIYWVHDIEDGSRRSSGFVKFNFNTPTTLGYTLLDSTSKVPFSSVHPSAYSARFALLSRVSIGSNLPFILIGNIAPNIAFGVNGDSQTSTYTRGFIYPLNTNIFPSCYTQIPSSYAGYGVSSASTTTATFAVDGADFVDVATPASSTSHICFKEDSNSDTSSTSQRQSSLDLIIPNMSNHCTLQNKNSFTMAADTSVMGAYPLYYHTETNSNKTLHASTLPAVVNVGASPDQCIHPFSMTWSADLDGTPSFSDSRYPAISISFSAANQDYEFDMDFSDAPGTYHGKLDVSVNCTFPSGDTTQLIFSIQGYSFCESHANSITLNAISSITHHLFVEEQQQLTWSITKAEPTCTEAVTYKVMVYNGATWDDISALALATEGSYADFPTASSLTWTIQDDPATYPAADYLSLKNSAPYTFKIYASNAHTALFHDYWQSASATLTIIGCKVTPPTIPDMTFTIHGGQVNYQVYHVWWVIDDGLVTPQCSILSYDIVYLQSEDGSTSTYNDWAAKVSVSQVFATHMIAILPAGFTDNKYGGQWHELQMRANVQADTTSGYTFYKPATVKVHVNKDCSSVTFTTATNTANHASIVDFTYTIGDPAHVISIAQFVASDAYCTVVHAIEVARRDGSGTLTTAERDSLITFTAQAQGNGIDHSLAIESATDVSLVGEYYLRIQASITEASGTATTQIQVNMDIKHWCTKVAISTTAVSSADYYLEDASHATVMAAHPQPLVLSFTKFTASRTLGATSLTEAQIQTGCGVWTYEVQKYTAGTLGSLTLPYYTLSMADPNALSLSIHSTDKTLMTGHTHGYFVDSLALVGGFANFMPDAAVVDFDVAVRDPCMTLQLGMAEFNDTWIPVEDMANITVIHSLIKALSVLSFSDVTQTVDLYDSATDTVSSTISSSSYCGAISYLLKYDDGVHIPFSVAEIAINATSGFREILIKETNLAFHNTDTNFTLTAWPSTDSGSVYPVFSLRFLVHMQDCEVVDMIPPDPQVFTYFLGSGNVTFTMVRSAFVQVQNCHEAAIVTSSLANGTAFNSSIIQFEDKIDEDLLIWRVEINETVYIEATAIRVSYYSVKSKFTYTDYEIPLLISQNVYEDSLTAEEPEEVLDFETPLPRELELVQGEILEFKSIPTFKKMLSASYEVSKAAPEGWEEFLEISIDPGTMEVKMAANPSASSRPGNYSVKFELTGLNSEGEEKTKEIEVVIKVEPQPEVELPPIVAPPELPIYDSGCRIPSGAQGCEPVAVISLISFTGEVEIKFDHEMTVPEGWNWWQGQNSFKHPGGEEHPIRVELLPGELQNASNIDFKWTMQEFSESSMKLHLDWEKPVLISTGITPDTLVVTFINREIFISVDTSESLLSESLHARMRVQMEQGKSTEQFIAATAAAKQGTQMTVLANFAMNIILQGSLQYIWGMINSLQVVFHLPGSQVGIPGNAKVLYSTLIEVTQFNVVPEEALSYFYVWNYLAPESADGQEGSSQNSRRRRLELEKANLEDDGESEENPNINMADIGYGSLLFVEGIETELVMIELFFVLVLLYCLTKWMSKAAFMGWTKKYFVKSSAYLNDFLFWNLPFRFLLEGYLGLCCCAFINLKPLLDGEVPLFGGGVHNIVSNISTLLMTTLLVGYPFFIYWRIHRFTEEDLVGNKELEDKIGSLYEGVKLTQNRRGLYYNVFFTLRRLAYAFVLVFLERSWLQILIMFIIQTWIMIYTGQCRPQDVRVMNYLEVFNEFLATVLCYHLVIFTDFYDNFEVRYLIGGKSMIITTVLIIAVNMINVLFAFYLELRKVYLKQLAILKRRNEVRRKLDEEIASKMKKAIQKKRQPFLGLSFLSLSADPEEDDGQSDQDLQETKENTKITAKMKHQRQTSFLTPKLKLITRPMAKVNHEAGIARFNSRTNSESSSSISQSRSFSDSSCSEVGTVQTKKPVGVSIVQGDDSLDSTLKKGSFQFNFIVPGSFPSTMLNSPQVQKSQTPGAQSKGSPAVKDQNSSTANPDQRRPTFFKFHPMLSKFASIQASREKIRKSKDATSQENVNDLSIIDLYNINEEANQWDQVMKDLKEKEEEEGRLRMQRRATLQTGLKLKETPLMKKMTQMRKLAK